MLLEESRELDQVLLDHDVFLSEFGLLQFETFLFATTIIRQKIALTLKILPSDLQMPSKLRT